MNEKKDTTWQNLQNAAKRMLKGKFMAVNTYKDRQGKTRVNNLTIHMVGVILRKNCGRNFRQFQICSFSFAMANR